MLLSVKKAYDKKVFNDQNPCAVGLETVEAYLKLLQPANILFNKFQSDHSSDSASIPFEDPK